VPAPKTKWRPLACATALRYASRGGTGKKINCSKPSGALKQPFFNNRLAPFYSAIWLPIRRVLQVSMKFGKSNPYSSAYELTYTSCASCIFAYQVHKLQNSLIYQFILT
jgi:hypothetical protein